MCAENGGVLDDVITYRLGPDRFLTVTNAANAAADAKRFAERAEGADAEAADVGERYAMVAVQGPRAREIVAGLAEGELPARMRVAPLRVAGAEALVCGTGYTGEDGVELLLDPDAARDAWDALMDAGVAPCGLAARDTLRLEACLPLYGNELTTERTPIAAGLGWCCHEDTGFIGAEAVAAERATGPAERLVAFALTGPGVPRAGNPVIVGGSQVGTVTSGTHSPSLGEGIGMAYVRAELAEPGTDLEIDVRGTRRAARVQRRPLYQRGMGPEAERSNA
jgi:aminomethyltransferase